MKKKFRVRGALSGGFGGTEFVEWEEIQVIDLDEATGIAYQMAINEYEVDEMV
jgi:hypothetical protein